MMADEIPERPFADLRSSGLLWLINRAVFHPRGFALALHPAEDGSITGWSLQGDGSEVWTFAGPEDDLFAAVQATFAAAEHGPCSCGNTGWVEDENWQAEHHERGQAREPHNGMIPCGFCNHGDWDAPWPPVQGATS